MKELKVFEFGGIFDYAKEYYGIDWNKCNDIFFNGSLEYGKHCTVYPQDWFAYIDENIPVRERASNYTKKEIEAMTDLDKSYVILSAYFEFNNVMDKEVLVDCT